VNDIFGGTIAGVTMTTTGGHTAITDASGAYTFKELPPGTYTVTPSKKPYMFTPPSRQVTIPPHANEVNYIGEIKNFIPLVLND
jgi:inhibitor of cysteine peptidase